MSQLQCLLEDKAGLGHGSLCRIHQQQHAVHHLQNSLHFTGKVSVSWRVHDIDFVALIVHGGVLGENRDAALPLQVAGIHDPIHHRLIFPIDTALLEHLVNQGRLAMVNVGDDRDISNVFLRHKIGPFQTDKSLNSHKLLF